MFYLAIAKVTKVFSKYADDNLLIWRKDRSFCDGDDVRDSDVECWVGLILKNKELRDERYLIVDMLLQIPEKFACRDRFLFRDRSPVTVLNKVGELIVINHPLFFENYF